MSSSTGVSALAAFALLAAHVSAQTITGDLEGRVIDSSGAAVSARVIVEGETLPVRRSTVAGDTGIFWIALLPPGLYRVTVNQDGFREVAAGHVVVQLGRTTSLGDLVLLPPTVTERVIVEAATPLIDPRRAGVTMMLSSDYFGALPLERDYRVAAELLPHANTSTLGDATNVAGGTGLENRFFIDGAEVTDLYRGAGSIHIPPDFVHEFEARVGGYAAEHRGALGGVVNIVTLSGSNRATGGAFAYFASDSFAGGLRQGAADLKRRRYRQWDAGVSVGGPMLADRLWYFTAYNPRFERLQVEVPGAGWHPEHTGRHSFAAKLSWRPRTGDYLQVTAVGDPSVRHGVGDLFLNAGTPLSFENPDPYLRFIRGHGSSLSLRGTHTVSQGLLESSLSITSRSFENRGDTSDDRPLFIDGPSGSWSGGSPSTADNPSRQLSGGLKVTWPLDRHQLKIGGDLRSNRQKTDWTARVVARFRDDFFFLFLLRDDHVVYNRGGSLFVQDDWRVSDRLHVNLGLRWDRELLIGSDGSSTQQFENEWQPRAGIVWRPGASGNDRIFAAAGRFYDSVLLYPVAANLSVRQQDFCYFDHDPRISPAGADCVIGGATAVAPELPGLEGQRFDELSLGYERALGRGHKAGVRGMVRTLQQGLENGWSEEAGRFVWGNPGSGLLREYPQLRRQYRALDVTLQRPGGALSYVASYVWSATVGNYPGLFNSDFEFPFPNTNGSFDYPELLANGDGPLPNDRPHVLKLSGSRRWRNWLTTGVTFLAASGTPLSEWGGTTRGAPFYGLLQPRGTAGRTPSLVDLNARLAMDLPFRRVRRSRVIVDGFHLLGRRTAVDYDQIHFFNVDQYGNQIDPNPGYGVPTRYWPPASLRLGFEIAL